MKKLVLTTKQLEDIYFEDSERFSVIEEGSWESKGKFETATFIFVDTETNTCYEGMIGRSGDCWSDYTYDSEWNDEELTLMPVVQKEVITVQWKEVDEESIVGEINIAE